jgi:hypothetical protein
MLSFLLEGFVEISEHRTTWLSVEIWRRCRTPNTGIYICGRLSEELGRGLRSTSRDQLGALDEVALTPLLKLSTRKRSLVLREHSQTFIHQGSGASFDSLPYVWSLRCFSPSRKEKHCMARNRLDVHTHLVRHLICRAATFSLGVRPWWPLSDCRWGHLPINQALRALQLRMAITKE